MQKNVGTCLIADDAPHIRTLIERWLAETGFDCYAVSGARQALQAAESHPPDIVITDLDMPDGDGLELLRAMRSHSHEHLRRTPVMVISSMIDSDIEKIVRERGGNAFICKPIAKTAFLQLFFHTLRRSECWGTFSKKLAAGTRSPTFRRLLAKELDSVDGNDPPPGERENRA